MAEVVYFDNGNQNIPLTGGWETHTYKDTSANKANASVGSTIVLSTYGNENAGEYNISSANAYTANTIDLTNIKTIKITGTGYFYITDIPPSNSGNVTNDDKIHSYLKFTYVSGSRELDVSGITGSHYLLCHDESDTETWSHANFYAITGVSANTPPTQPPTLTPDRTTCKPGDELTLTAGASTDPDGDTVTYVYEASNDNTNWVEILRTLQTACPYTAKINTNELYFRVYATDGQENTGYTYSPMVEVKTGLLSAGGIYGRRIRMYQMIVADMKVEIMKLEDKNTILTKQVSELESSNTSLRDTANSLAVQNSELYGEVNEAENTITTMELENIEMGQERTDAEIKALQEGVE